MEIFFFLAFFLIQNPLINGIPIEIDEPIKNKTGWVLQEALSAMAYSKNFNGSWFSDTEIMYKDFNGDYIIFDVKTKISKIFIANDQLPGWTRPKLFLSRDKKKFLIQHDDEKQFRHSTLAKYDVYHIETGTTYSIADKKKLQYCSFSPKSDRIVYVYANNVFVRQPNGTEYQLTTDGKVGLIYNGIPDWVYEEEVLSTGSAIWWSPNGDRIVIGHFDDTDVRSFKYFIYGEPADSNYQYPVEVDLKYPKSGSINPTVALKVIDLNKNLDSPKWINLIAPIEIVTEDHIMNTVTWSDNENIVILWQNRRQNKGVFQICDLNGNCRNILEVKEPNGWLQIKQLQCNNKTCTFINWIDNWAQVWNMDIKTGENLWTSMGNFTILKYYGIKKDTNDRFYQATLANDSAQIHVYRNQECLSCKLKDVNNRNCTQASASFSANLTHYVITCTGPGVSYTKIFNSNTQNEILEWQKNEEFRAYVESKLLPTIKYLRVPVENGFQALVKLYLPPGLDWNSTQKRKYPLVVDVYGGPNSAKINDALRIYWSTYMVIKHNLIYCEIESRGSGNKGRDMLYTINNRLGTYEVTDQINVTNYLQKNYNFIDASRSGIWGWSYGGYATAMAMGKDDRHVFQCGISVAPVTAWYYYDSIYTERYMGLPNDKDNLANYVKSDVTKHIKNFESHDFMLIHGLGDDNVHAQQSFLLSRALEENNILFEEMLYPDEDHSIRHLIMHLYHTMDNFWIKCLGLDNEDEENVL